MTGKASEPIFPLDTVVKGVDVVGPQHNSPIHLHPAQIEAWLEEMKNWSMPKFSEYFNGLTVVARQRFMFIVWHSFDLGTAMVITEAVLWSAEARAITLRAERDGARKQLSITQDTLNVREQELHNLRAQKDEHLRQKGNRIIELENKISELTSALEASHRSFTEERDRVQDIARSLFEEQRTSARLRAQLEAAEGAAKTFARLLSAAEEKAEAGK